MSLSSKLSKILIIDFGSQFTQLIARRIRELGVFSEYHPTKKINIKNILQDNIRGIILSGDLDRRSNIKNLVLIKKF